MTVIFNESISLVGFADKVDVVKATLPDVAPDNMVVKELASVVVVDEALVEPDVLKSLRGSESVLKDVELVNWPLDDELLEVLAAERASLLNTEVGDVAARYDTDVL